MVKRGGRSSVVEFQPSKLAVVGSNPIARSNEDVKREDGGKERHCSTVDDSRATNDEL